PRWPAQGAGTGSTGTPTKPTPAPARSTTATRRATATSATGCGFDTGAGASRLPGCRRARLLAADQRRPQQLRRQHRPGHGMQEKVENVDRPAEPARREHRQLFPDMRLGHEGREAEGQRRDHGETEGNPVEVSHLPVLHCMVPAYPFAPSAAAGRFGADGKGSGGPKAPAPVPRGPVT